MDLVVLDLLKECCTLLLLFLKLDAQLTFLHQFVEIVFAETANVIFLVGVGFLFILFLEQGLTFSRSYAE